MFRTVMLVFLSGIMCQNPPNDEEEMVGIGELTKLRLAAARAKVRQNIALAKIRAHRIPHLLLAVNPSYTTNINDSYQSENYPDADASLYTLQNSHGFNLNITDDKQRRYNHQESRNGNYLIEDLQRVGVEVPANSHDIIPTTNQPIYLANGVVRHQDDFVIPHYDTPERISNHETSFTRLRGIKNTAKDEQLFIWSLNNMQHQNGDGFVRKSNNVAVHPKAQLKCYQNLRNNEKSTKQCWRVIPTLFVTNNKNFETINNKFNKIKQMLTSMGNFPVFATNNAPTRQRRRESQTLLLGQQMLDNQSTKIRHRPDDILGKPYLFHIPVNNMRHNVDFRRSSDRVQTNAPRRTTRHERSLPLLTLITNPDAKFDIYKTAENVGTVTRNTLEDDKAPILHAKNLLVSAKNAILSILRIPSQNVIIPSQYKISDKYVDDIPLMSSRFSDVLSSENPENQVQDTFQKLGAVLKKSIKSGRETLQHVGDAAHSARKIIITTRQSAPKFLLPYFKTPVLKSNDVFLKSRFGDVKDERDDCVGLGNIMDALGISNPDNKKITLRSRFGDDFTPNLKSNNGNDGELESSEFKTERGDGVRDHIQGILDKLRRFKTLSKTPNDLPTRFDPMLLNRKPDVKFDVGESYEVESHEVEHDPELKDFLTELFTARKKIKKSGQSALERQTNSIEETVGSALPLTKKLLEPFMGLETYTKKQNKIHRYNNRNIDDHWGRFDDLENGTNEYASGESKEMRLSKSLLKPFMGKRSRKKI